MSARYLRKDGDPYLYAWTEALAARGDMKEVAGPESPDVDEPADIEDIVYALTTAKELKAFADEHGLVLTGAAKGIKGMQNEIIALAKGAGLETAADEKPL